MTRRNIPIARLIRVLTAGTTLFWGADLAFAGQAGLVSGQVSGQVWRTPSCGCCKAWVEHMQSKGFDLSITDMPAAELGQKKTALGVGGALASCHTAAIGGYTIEGHVPAEDVARLLKEKPEAIGLSVPGMPAGSPGMEMGERHDAYDVLLVKKDGTSPVFAHHAAPMPGSQGDAKKN
jgi:hypothetical protein